MSSFLRLVLINIRSTFSSGKISMTNNKITKVITMLVLIVFPLIYIGYIGYILGEQLALVNMQKMLIILAIISSVSVVLINSIVTSFDLLFKSKDYDFLSSLPIPQSTIFSAKVVSVLLINYLYSIIVFLPFSVCYFIFSGVTFISIISVIITFLFLPLIPIAIGILIGLIINLITAKFRLKKLFIFLSLILLTFGAMYISYDLNSTVSYFVANGEQLTSTMSKIYYPVFLSIDAIVNNNLLSILWYILINSAPIILIVMLCSKFYIKLNSYFMKSHYKIDKNLKKIENTSVKKALIGKEFKRMLASPFYIMNSCLGPILLLVFTIAILFVPSETILGFDISSDVFSLAFIIFMFNSIISPMSCSISLEGETFWLAKSFPLKPSTILNCKLVLQLLIFVPLNILSILILALANSFTIVQILLLVLTALVSIIFSGVVGLILNLKNYNLHYKNELMVIKQSGPVFFGMIIGIVTAMLFNFLYSYVFVTIMSSTLFILLFSLLVIIACVIIYYQITHIKYEQFIQID